MREAVRGQYEAFPDPSPAVEPIGPGQLDRIDDNLHFGWSWHRHQYCYRRGEGLRILDAGCGTGLTTLGLARLNPGATVVGVDASPASLDLAALRAGVAGMPAVAFREHDLERPFPGSWGPFDFIVCRRVLGQAEDPARVLEHLARVLDDRGLIYLTLPTRVGRQPARQMALAVEALAGPGAALDVRARVGLELLQALRPDHPIRQHEARLHGNTPPTPERFVATYLNEAERDWTLAEAAGLLERAGLQYLFVAGRWAWRADRVFALPAVSGALKARVDATTPLRRDLLIDALDPMIHLDEYRIFACPAGFEPRIPAWPEERAAHPEVFDRLIPHPTGLARPRPGAGAGAGAGRTSYEMSTGAPFELDARLDLALRAADGRRSCGEIDRMVAVAPGAGAGMLAAPDERQRRWLDLADNGIVLLESPDPRQHVDCRHLGPIRDRLDCACPRRWVRACEVHGHCTIARVPADDTARPALDAALARLGVEAVIACAECPDYEPEEV